MVDLVNRQVEALANHQVVDLVNRQVEALANHQEVVLEVKALNPIRHQEAVGSH